MSGALEHSKELLPAASRLADLCDLHRPAWDELRPYFEVGTPALCPCFAHSPQGP